MLFLGLVVEAPGLFSRVAVVMPDRFDQFRAALTADAKRGLAASVLHQKALNGTKARLYLVGDGRVGEETMPLVDVERTLLVTLTFLPPGGVRDHHPTGGTIAFVVEGWQKQLPEKHVEPHILGGDLL